jgi:NAD(P)H-dependent FMN reductase
MKKIITIGGSTSRKSINKQLAEYAGSLVKDADLTKVDLNDYPMPLYSIDIENEEGISKNVTDLVDVIEGTDGIVISLAEHNGSYTAAFKNTMDWMSRAGGKLWKNKPMLLLSTSPGARGGKSVMESALARFPYGGANIISSLSVPSFYENFKEGAVVNQDLNLSLLERVAEFENAL